MSVSAEMITQLRRMVAEPATTTYSDADLAGYIELYPLRSLDQYDAEAIAYDPCDLGWTPTYDLHRAAADIWHEKAAALAANYNLTADGATLSRSEAYEHAMAQARSHLARRRLGAITQYPVPEAKAEFIEAEGDA